MGKKIFKPVGISSKKGQRHRVRMIRRATLLRKRMPFYQVVALDIVKKICIENGWRAFPERAIFCKANRRWYIADIFVKPHSLIIEIDGSSHEKATAYDKWRDDNLRLQGINTIRFKNKEVESPNFKMSIMGSLIKLSKALDISIDELVGR